MNTIAQPPCGRAVSGFSALLVAGAMSVSVSHFSPVTAVGLFAFVGLGMALICLLVLSVFTGTEIGASGKPIFHEILFSALAVIVLVAVPMWMLGQIPDIIGALLSGFCFAMFAATGDRRDAPKALNFHLGMLGMAVSYCAIVYLAQQKFA